ncbi:MobH family relaxase [Methylomonas sp. UP202]|uniref:MobH family relaxase n=1 Tax=Methylomonas sp. UP202 TaxID=3040943 RepID=UPI002479F0AD|nr:MobH family relaxase [Methylomonas sp. UP202]WGS88677.1 MobH family relaxase [Methylomonas sp. UP202]
MFASLINRILGVAELEEDVPRYPPFAKGLPVRQPQKILESQAELIQKIRHYLSVTDEEYQLRVYPLILNYARFVHLLPASEKHHHRGAGGLFRHGLEVGYEAVYQSHGVLYGIDETPAKRKQLTPRWRLAIFIAGMLHDLGKPVTDIEIKSEDGRDTCNILGNDIETWAKKLKIQRYYLHWRANRHGDHEVVSAALINKIIIASVSEYLNEYGPTIYKEMLLTIAGTSHHSRMFGLVMDADYNSVERDLKENCIPIDPSIGAPIEWFILDAMRQLVKKGKWADNVKRAIVWRLKEGLFIVWDEAAEEICRLITQNNIPGIPKHPDTLADILFDRQLAVPYRIDAREVRRYWTIQPDCLDTPLRVLKLSDPRHVYPEAAPLIVNGQVIHIDDRDGQPDPIAGIDIVAATSARADDNVSTPGAPHHPLSAPETAPRAVVETEAREVLQVGSPNPAASSHAQLSPPTAVPDASEPREAAKLAEIQVARQWLASKSVAGDLLIKTIDSGSADHFQIQPKGRVLVLHQQIAVRIGQAPIEIVRALDAAEMIEVDPRKPMVKVTEIGGVKGVLLNQETSRNLAVLIHTRGSTPVSQQLGQTSEDALDTHPPAQRLAQTQAVKSGSLDDTHAIEQLIQSIKAFELPFAIKETEDGFIVDMVLLKQYIEDKQLFEFKQIFRYVFNRQDIQIDNTIDKFIVKKS